MAGLIGLPGVTGALRDAAAVLLPVSCAACGKAGRSLCGACGLLLRGSVRVVAERATVPGVPLVSAAAYGGVAGALVRAFKLRGRADAADPLAGLLRIALLAALRAASGPVPVPALVPGLRAELGAWGEAVPGAGPGSRDEPGPVSGPAPGSRGELGLVPGSRAELELMSGLGARGEQVPVLELSSRAAAGSRAGERPLLLVTAPSRAGAERARGMRHLAEACAHAVPGAAVLPVLRFARRVADQRALSASGRLRNVAGSMRASRSVAGRRIVLVDDVVTSGATVREAARAVRAEGGRVIAIAVMTRAASTSNSRSAAP